MFNYRPRLKGLEYHDRFYDGPVLQRPVTARMVETSSAMAKLVRGNRRFRCSPSASKKAVTLYAGNRGTGSGFLDLDLALFHPNGCYSMRISRIPGTRQPLPVAWRIYFDNGRYMAPINQRILKRFNVVWPGNIVMVKLRPGEDFIGHITPKEDHYADVLLGLWLREFGRVRAVLDVEIPFT
ncbi:hypothetical protein C8R43DRAFT_1132808 [Mycena crocata]|nr:hypothetical protein C8R43DRAFT_1132808 [Mycena crocata]